MSLNVALSLWKQKSNMIIITIPTAMMQYISIHNKL